MTRAWFPGTVLLFAVVSAACPITSTTTDGDGGSAEGPGGGGDSGGSTGDGGATSDAGGGSDAGTTPEGGATCAPSKLSLTPALGTTIDANAFGLAAGDLNGDGKGDVVVGQGDTFGALLNKGDGTFAAVTTTKVPADIYARGLALGDFNGDGKLDVVGSGNGVSNPSFYALGNGDGTFAAPVQLDLKVYPDNVMAQLITIADFDKDGHLDVIVPSSAGSKFGILSNPGNGQLTGDVDYAVPVVFQAMTVGDFNGDGYPDVAIGASVSPPTVYVYLNSGAGSFSAAPTKVAASSALADQNSGISSLVAADFDGDGKIDLAVHLGEGTLGTPDAVAIVLGHGNGSFTTATASMPAEGQSSHLVQADLNADQKPDLFLVNGTSFNVDVFMNTGAGAFASYQSYSTGGASAQNVLVQGAPADFLGNGMLGVAVTVVDVNAGAPGSMKVLLPRCAAGVADAGVADASAD